MKKFTIIILIQIIIYLAAGFGEVRCIVKAINCNWETPYKAEIIYTVSACTGLGAIVGYIDIKDN